MNKGVDNMSYSFGQLELNNEEKRSGRVSLYNMIQIYDVDMVLMNSIPELDYEGLEWEDLSVVYDENDYPVNIYQWFVVNNYELFKKLKYPVAYSNLLDCWVVGITHWGTSWRYCLTNQSIDDYKNWFSNYDNY